MITTPIYMIKNQEKFQEAVQKFKALSEEFSKTAHYIKLTPVFSIKEKYLILTVPEHAFTDHSIDNPTLDTLAYLIYWLYKNRMIEHYGFITDKGLITKKNPNLFTTYKAIINFMQKLRYSGRPSKYLYSLDSEPLLSELETHHIICSFEPKTIIDNGTSKIVTLNAYYSIVPDCNLDECYKLKWFPRSSPIMKLEYILVIDRGSVTWYNREINNKFTLLDIILLSLLKKYIPYKVYKHAKIEVIRSIKTLPIPPLIKALLGMHYDTHYIGFNKKNKTFTIHDNLDIELWRAKAIVTRDAIELAKYLPLESTPYKEEKIIKVPPELKDLFKPTHEKIDVGVYVKYDNLCTPALLIKDNKYFISEYLTILGTIIGILKKSVPFKINPTREEFIVNFYDKATVSIDLSGKYSSVKYTIKLHVNKKGLPETIYITTTMHRDLKKELLNIIFNATKNTAQTNLNPYLK